MLLSIIRPGRRVLAPMLAAVGILAVPPTGPSVSSLSAPISAEASADVRTLTKLDDDWSKSAGTKDIDKVISFYSEDAIACPPNEPIAVGRAAVKKVWATYLALPEFAISWKTVHADAAASDDLGYTAGTYELSFKGPDGKPVTERGKYLCAWKKLKDGSWKAVHDMWNSDTK